MGLDTVGRASAGSEGEERAVEIHQQALQVLETLRVQASEAWGDASPVRGPAWASPQAALELGMAGFAEAKNFRRDFHFKVVLPPVLLP